MSHEAAKWNVKWRVDKFDDRGALLNAGIDPDNVTAAKLDEAMGAGRLTPTAFIDGEGNLLTTEGVNALWSMLTGSGTATAGQDLTYFNNANAHIGVGNSTTVAAAGDTDLLGGSKLFKAMEATYPTIATNQITFRSVFGSGEAEFAWEEWGVANNSAPGTAGRLLNRKVEALGTKGAGSTWTFTCTISIS